MAHVKATTDSVFIGYDAIGGIESGKIAKPWSVIMPVAEQIEEHLSKLLEMMPLV